MQIHSLATHHASEMDRLGDEIAELSAHLDAATARLLELVRAFDARGGWNTGFRSCAAWLSWRGGLIWARPGNGSGSRALWGHYLSSPKPWPAGSCPTRRSAPSLASLRRRRKPAC